MVVIWLVVSAIDRKRRRRRRGIDFRNGRKCERRRQSAMDAGGPAAESAIYVIQYSSLLRCNHSHPAGGRRLLANPLSNPT